MIVAVVLVVASLALATSRRHLPIVANASPLRQGLIRTAGAVAAAAFAVVALALLDQQDRAAGYAVIVGLLAASLLELSGLVVWHGRVGYVLRLCAWPLAFGVVAVPSTLSLLFPLTLIFLLTAEPMYHGRGGTETP